MTSKISFGGSDIDGEPTLGEVGRLAVEMITPATETWDRLTAFSVCSLDTLGDHVAPNLAGYFALLNRAPDSREALLAVDYSGRIFERVRSLVTNESPIKWANPTHVAFEVMPPEDPANREELTARRIRLSTLIDDLNPRFKG